MMMDMMMMTIDLGRSAQNVGDMTIATTATTERRDRATRASQARISLMAAEPWLRP
eukprot:CAMPEP_0177403268 /NCGR_PEP_ID=MMETSP0368-20130122/60735_1 /TAXON_ID=447022 ORGANISM="Scrippsiella hangoei-like, Strain SHHI-4" /NCGR_SAMPLE_ID=MMETSP0368 /ASSEMBLY_ACC=CAM_ASM_000363 /LENGTH=55 /DNA_ID=CAMNT_0018871189 /DNA_START=85 /DNA_END=248 /DNA_ORIENTATION=-